MTAYAIPLPYAWSVVTRLVDELHATDAKATYNEIAPPDEKGYGQLFRMLASTSIRGAMERHFGVQLAFQNCCKVAVFRPDATEEYANFITLEAQILNRIRVFSRRSPVPPRTVLAHV